MINIVGRHTEGILQACGVEGGGAHEREYGRTDEQTDGGTEEGTDERMERRTDGGCTDGGKGAA